MSDQTEPNVGQRIRALREQQGLSLRTLSERCGLSINAISLIERGENSPTVSSLHLLATALGVSITEFFQNEHDKAIVFVKPDARLVSASNGIRMESLGIGLRNQQLEPFLLTVGSGVGNFDQPITHTGQEFVLCLEGTIQYCISDRIYHLEPGCSLLFEATLPHCFHNASNLAARLCIVFYAGGGNHTARLLHLESPLTSLSSE